MKPIQILIVDENPDFAKSLRSLIIDVFGEKSMSFEYVNNVQDGLKLIGKESIEFAFLRVSLSSKDTAETKKSFRDVSINPFVKVIALSCHNESVSINNDKYFETRRYYNKETIDVDEFVSTLESMK